MMKLEDLKEIMKFIKEQKIDFSYFSSVIKLRYYMQKLWIQDAYIQSRIYKRENKAYD